MTNLLNPNPQRRNKKISETEQLKEELQEYLEMAEEEKEEAIKEEDVQRQIDELDGYLEQLEEDRLEEMEEQQALQEEYDQDDWFDFLEDESEVDLTEDTEEEQEVDWRYQDGPLDELGHEIDNFLQGGYTPTVDPEELTTDAEVGEEKGLLQILYDSLFDEEEQEEVEEEEYYRDYTPISMFDHRETFSDKEMEQMYRDIHAYQHNIYDGDTYIGDKHGSDRQEKDNAPSVQHDIYNGDTYIGDKHESDQQEKDNGPSIEIDSF